jgi:transcriptional regulator GlxA family with amidase domain
MLPTIPRLTPHLSGQESLRSGRAETAAIVLLSPTGDDVTSNLGVGLAVEGAVSPEPAPHTFLVPGSSLYPRTVVPQDLAEAVRVPAARAGRVASICTGAFILAAAGLLDGKRATTHWKVTHELAAQRRFSTARRANVEQR